jgi:hypothetical protein
MPITRRHLQLALGSLWLLDGVLQCQPFMFSRAFAHRILAPAAAGQPSLVAVPLHAVAVLVAAQPIVSNGLFAIVQVLLGLAILSRRFTRVALGASIGWALSVWVVGEGLGGVATGATFLVGAPGAALLYAAIAVCAWPVRDSGRDARPSWLALPIWSALWFIAAALQLVHGNDSTTSLTMTLRGAQSSAPHWIARLDGELARLHVPSWTVAAMVAVYVLVAMWSLLPGWTRRLSLGIGVLISLTSWLLFQGLGDLTSGQSTDPNIGPLMVLLALAVIGAYPNDVNEGSRATSNSIALRPDQELVHGEETRQPVRSI